MISFDRSGHYMWGRRFRLPTLYVYAQTAPALASGRIRGDFSICYLAIGWFNAEESVYAEVDRRKRLPHSHPDRGSVVRRAGPRDGQGCFRAGMAERCAGSTSGRRRALLWRKRKTILSTPGLGDHAQSCACTAAAHHAIASDYTLAERFYGSTGQQHPGPDWRGLLAR